MAQEILVVFALFEGVTQLDFTGPHQVLSRLPGAKVIAASVGGQPIEADGLIFANLTPLEAITRCDVLCVPGGFGATAAALDKAFLDHIRRLAADARYVTSVCTGSLILGAAGLLKGRRASTHWAWRDQLALFGAIPSEERVTRDGNLFTGGGVTAGIDFALTLAAEIAGDEAAQTIQLGLEYAPAPPFDAGSPRTAPAAVIARLVALTASGQPTRRAQAEEAARRLTG